MEREESKMCEGNTCEFCMFADISPKTIEKLFLLFQKKIV